MTEVAPRSNLQFSSMSEAALLVDAASVTLSDAIQEKIWRLATQVLGWSHVTEAVPGMNNLLIVFDPMALDPSELEACICAAWDRDDDAGITAGRTIEVPVIYGGDSGVDLAVVAAHCGLSVVEVAQLHAAGDYSVYALGSQPGFGYLGGMDDRLSTPRRAVPRTRIEAGCVVIGGAQTGVISCASPSGWNIIGRTDLRFFDPARTPPILLAPGDRIRFHVEAIEP